MVSARSEVLLIHFEESVFVDAPPETVFEFVSSFENLPEWDNSVTAARRLDSGPLGIGSTYDVALVFGGRRIPMRYTVAGYEPSRWAVLEGVAEGFAVKDTIEVEPSGTGSRLTYQVELRLYGWTRLAQHFIAWFFERQAHATLARLPQVGRLAS